MPVNAHASISVPQGYESFDPTRPFPVLCTGSFHTAVVRELNACADGASSDEAIARAVWALFTRTKGEYRYTVLNKDGVASESVERCRYLALRERLAKRNKGGAAEYTFKACEKYLRSLRKLNPVIDEVWRDAGRAPRKRRLAPAFLAALARHAVAVDISKRGLSDLGLRVFLGSREMARAAAAEAPTARAAGERAPSASPSAVARRAEAGVASLGVAPQPVAQRGDARISLRPVVRGEDVRVAGDARLFPGRGTIWAFYTKQGEEWRDEAREASSLPALVRVDSALFPPARGGDDASFVWRVLAERRRQALAWPRRLLLPAKARDAVRWGEAFVLARETDLFGRVACFDQLIHGRWERVELAVGRVVEDEDRGLFLMGVRLSERGALRLWSAPVREGAFRWVDSGAPIASLAAADEIARLLAVLDARLSVAAGAVTDVPLEIVITLRGDKAARNRDARLVRAREAQEKLAAQELGVPRASRYATARCTPVQRVDGEERYAIADVASGRNELAAALRSRADDVRSVEARYAVRPDDPEQQLEGEGYDYLWAWDGNRLMGLGGSAVALVQAYDRLDRLERPARADAAARDEQGRAEDDRAPDACADGEREERVAIAVHHRGTSQEYVEVAPAGERAHQVPLAKSVRRWRERQEREGQGRDRQYDEARVREDDHER